MHLFTHDESHGTPDAVFPNNWFSCSPPGDTLVLWPMKCPTRRKERRADLVGFLEGRQGWRRTIDLTAHETGAAAPSHAAAATAADDDEDPASPAPSSPPTAPQQLPCFLEGTGSIVFDHLAKVAFVALSERSDEALAREALGALGYSLCAFHATDADGTPIYHTNVMLAVGTGVAVWCVECVKNEAEREAVHARLSVGGLGSGTRDVVAISLDQVNGFCGNILEVVDGAGKAALVMSSRAHEAFTDAQRSVLLKQAPGGLLHVPLPTIEAVGGGGARCCIGELF